MLWAPPERVFSVILQALAVPAAQVPLTGAVPMVVEPSLKVMAPEAALADDPVADVTEKVVDSVTFEPNVGLEVFCTVAREVVAWLITRFCGAVLGLAEKNAEDGASGVYLALRLWVPGASAVPTVVSVMPQPA